MLGRLHRLVVAFGIGLGLAALLGATLFAHRDLLGVDIMEARNLITARGMIETGALVRPHLARGAASGQAAPADLDYGRGHAGRKRRAGHGPGRESHPSWRDCFWRPRSSV